MEPALQSRYRTVPSPQRSPPLPPPPQIPCPSFPPYSQAVTHLFSILRIVSFPVCAPHGVSGHGKPLQRLGKTQLRKGLMRAAAWDRSDSRHQEPSLTWIQTAHTRGAGVLQISPPPPPFRAPLSPCASVPLAAQTGTPYLPGPHSLVSSKKQLLSAAPIRQFLLNVSQPPNFNLKSCFPILYLHNSFLLPKYRA